MSKYIIKNCPACMVNPMFRTPDYFCNDIAIEERILHCDSRANCVMKQIVELCKEDLKPVREWQEGNTVFAEHKKDTHLANSILKLLDIQEVE